MQKEAGEPLKELHDEKQALLGRWREAVKRSLNWSDIPLAIRQQSVVSDRIQNRFSWLA